jgi:two-component system, sensor histidine kinase and response regulator
MTEHLRASQTELARSNAELERFAYVASHDLREPLRTITGFLGLLSRRHRDRLDDDGREFVDMAVDGAKRMDRLIADLLEFSRAGRRETEPEAIDVGAAWGVAVRNLGAAIAESGAEVTAGPLPTVLADRGEMVQVLQNLLGNAIKYRNGHPPHIHAAAVRRGEEWEISVSDDGPGVDPRHHERIFVLLHRLHSRDDVEGTGIGLAICKKIVERHGGRIWVESTPGEASAFHFTLPKGEQA